MCGICGVVDLRGGEPAIPKQRFLAMREALAHRGPDDAGLHESPGVLIGHRRLIVLDPSPAGAQPMSTPDGRFTIAYNGEIYNEPALRAQLESTGVRFRSACDTETVLHAVARWGTAAGSRLRGMYAIAVWDRAERSLLLARDPFGMKPLHWAVVRGAVVFASEAAALFEHPGLRPEPDDAVVSAYLSTLRTTLGDRTIFAGVRTVRPGEWLRFDPATGADEPDRSRPEPLLSRAGLTVREAVEGSVRAHLRSDVPWCSLLSGGLDSTIVATIAAHRAPGLRTYVSGCPDAGEGLSDDFEYARIAAAEIGTRHHEVPIGAEDFRTSWPLLIEQTGLPLTTPNTVAIHAVAAALRGGGNVVALSGEGADELFGGYDLPLRSALEHFRKTGEDTDADSMSVLLAACWMRPDHKHDLLNTDFWDHAEQDARLFDDHASAWTAALDEARARRPGSCALERRFDACLGLQRRLNLTALLERLDLATMRASVEGRTPLADPDVAHAAGALALEDKFELCPDGTCRSKVALREAFRGDIPPAILERPKRSFPLPFAAWMGSMEQTVSESRLVGRIYTPATVRLALSDPARWWHLAWPMTNLALWDRRWWG